MGPKKTLFVKLRICLMVSAALLLGACSCFPKDLNVKPKQILKRLNTCYVYTVKADKSLVFDYESEMPIDDCLKDGNFVLTAEEMQTIRRNYKSTRECVDNASRCQNGN